MLKMIWRCGTLVQLPERKPESVSLVMNDERRDFFLPSWRNFPSNTVSYRTKSLEESRHMMLSDRPQCPKKISVSEVLEVQTEIESFLRFSLWDRVSRIPHWPQTPHRAEDNPELLILFSFVILSIYHHTWFNAELGGATAQGLHTLGKHSANWATSPAPRLFYFWRVWDDLL